MKPNTVRKPTDVIILIQPVLWWLVLLYGIPSAACANTTRCFECIDLPLPLYCTRVAHCVPGQKCVVEKIVTSGGLTLYNSGCMFNTRCNSHGRRSLSKSTSQLRRSDVTVCIECCEDEFCNHGGCGFQPQQQPERGPLCFQCDMFDTPEQCRNIVECNLGEECMLTELHSLSPDGRRLYKSACKAAKDCQASLYSSIAVIGKKRGTICHTCCKEDFCNDKCTFVPITTSPPTPQTTSRPTTQPTSPPTTTPTSRPTTLPTSPPTTTPTSRPTTHPTPPPTTQPLTHPTTPTTQTTPSSFSDKENVYLGGKDTSHNSHHHDNEFHWPNGAKLGFTAWAGDQPDGGEEDCLYTSFKYNWTWHDTQCDNAYAYICTMEL